MELILTILSSCILLAFAVRDSLRSDMPVRKCLLFCVCVFLPVLSVFAAADCLVMGHDAAVVVICVRLLTSASALACMAGRLDRKTARLLAAVMPVTMAFLSITWMMESVWVTRFLTCCGAAVLASSLALLFCKRKVTPAVTAAVEKKTPQSAAARQTEDERMAVLYDRVQEYMRENRPYLEADFSEDDMASALYTNKAYLSRTINRNSGMNFCRYVNSFRVEYAISLMREDARMKVTEISIMAGFHTVVSFNMAFKLVTNCTPSEYQRNIQAERL